MNFWEISLQSEKFVAKNRNIVFRKFIQNRPSGRPLGILIFMPLLYIAVSNLTFIARGLAKKHCVKGFVFAFDNHITVRLIN